MKKCFLVIIIVNLVLVYPAVAQQDSLRSGVWFIDYLFGINQSRLSGSEVDFMKNIVSGHNDGSLVVKSRTGVEAGMLIRRTLGKNVHLKTGLQYIQRGASLENTRYVVKPMMSSDYVGMPVVLGAQTSNYHKPGKFGLFIESGVTFLINASDKSSSWVDKTYPLIDFVLETGAEIGITKKLTIGLRYKFMKDLNHAYTVARQYDINNLALKKNYDYFYSTNTFLISLRQKI